MSTRPNWHKIADDLAERLMHSASCYHATDEPDCPFCADRRAYAAYLAAGGTVRPPSYEGTTTVTLAELANGEAE